MKRKQYHTTHFNDKKIRFEIDNNTLWLEQKYVTKYIFDNSHEWASRILIQGHGKIYHDDWRVTMNTKKDKPPLQYSLNSLLELINFKYGGRNLFVNDFETWFVHRCRIWKAQYRVNRDLLAKFDCAPLPM